MQEQEKKEVLIINEDIIRSKIYTIRGQKVMLDADLAEIYGYTTKTFNQQVKNNIEKFDEDFRFQLNDEELENLRSQNVTSNWGGMRYNPYAFSEQGIYMLMTVLKGDLAVRQSKALIRTFKRMKDFLANNHSLIGNEEVLRLSLQTTQNTADIAFLKENMVTKSEFSKIIKNFNDPSVKKEYLIYNGKVVEAVLAYQQIYNSAKKTIFIIDNYIGLKTLLPLKEVGAGVKCIVFSDNLMKGLHKTEYDDFVREYPNLEISFQKACNQFHDRYIIIDYKKKTEKIYHCGASSKDAGKRVTAITQIVDSAVYYPLIDAMVGNPQLELH